MFPNEKRELSAGCTEDKTEGRAGGLHKIFFAKRESGGWAKWRLA